MNAHGTATELGDIAESQATHAALGSRTAVSSTKGATGHMLGAAGAIEMAVCVKALQTNTVPPTINYEHPDPQCDLDYCANTARDLKIDPVEIRRRNFITSFPYATPVGLTYDIGDYHACLDKAVKLADLLPFDSWFHKVEA